MTISELTTASYVYIGMDHFAKPDDELARAQQTVTLQRNFQGYTTHADCDLLAMGVSAISLINHCFSQNVKTLDTYYHQLDQGRIPVMKDYQLVRDDQIRKMLIQQLSCHFVVQKSQIEAAFDINFGGYFADELAALSSFMDDQLVQVSQDAVLINDRGRLLIRNIGMVFDAHLNQQTKQQFSKVI